MAMAVCRECKNPVSDAAKACPTCGIPSPVKKPSTAAVALLGLAAIVIAVGISSRCSDHHSSYIDGAPAPAVAALTQQEAAARRRENQELALAVAAGLQIKSMLRNPSSFSYGDTYGMPDGAICITYRAQNGFGGMNVENAVAIGDTIVGQSADIFASSWKKHCAHKIGVLLNPRLP